MKLIIDTNIVFSALLNSSSPISNLIFNSTEKLELFSCLFMKYEIEKHWGKIYKISKVSNDELNKFKLLLYSKINFIDESTIPQNIWIDSEKVLENIDLDDTPFVALSKYTGFILWTGDKKLYNWIKKTDFVQVINTSELLFFQ